MILFGQRGEEQIVAEPPRRIAVALFFAQHAEGDPEMTQHLHQRQHGFAARRIVSAHAAQPEAIFLGAVVDRQRVLLDELLPLARRHAQRIAVALHGEEQLRAVGVFPGARIHGAAAQADDHRQMLNSHRALEFAGAAGGALEHGFFGNVGAEQRSSPRPGLRCADSCAARESLLSD